MELFTALTCPGNSRKEIEYRSNQYQLSLVFEIHSEAYNSGWNSILRLIFFEIWNTIKQQTTLDTHFRLPLKVFLWNEHLLRCSFPFYPTQIPDLYRTQVGKTSMTWNSNRKKNQKRKTSVNCNEMQKLKQKSMIESRANPFKVQKHCSFAHNTFSSRDAVSIFAMRCVRWPLFFRVIWF